MTRITILGATGRTGYALRRLKPVSREDGTAFLPDCLAGDRFVGESPMVGVV